MTRLRERAAVAQAAAALAALAAVALGCSPQERDRDVEFRVPVTAREVGQGTVEDRIVATGTLRAAEAVSLRAETSGALRVGRHASGRRLAEGDRVEAGQLIAEVTGEDVRVAARTEATEQRYSSAKREHESNLRLYEEGLVSEMTLRASETALAEAKIELDRSRLTEERSRLVTPIGGVLLRLARDEQGLPAADGQLVTQGQVLAQVAPIGQLVADVDLVGPDVARVEPGQPARVRHHAWADELFEGRVVRLAPVLDPTTRTLQAEVAVRNPAARLRPGMFVEVTVVAERRENVPVVPREAVTERRGRKVVFVVEGQRVAERAVGLGLGDDDVVEITSGLEGGEQIVVRGLETLADGTRVSVSGA